jgi:serine/threonine protein kinase
MSSPTSVVSRKINQNKFWLEASALEGICALISRNGFQGKISNKGGDSFLVKECVSEDSSSHLPNYIARLESYTELECRELIRQMAENIRALHEQRVVHRNLNIDNVLVVQVRHSVESLMYNPLVAQSKAAYRSLCCVNM